MSYAEVKQYTQLYGLQQAFDELQKRAFNTSLDVVGLATLLQRKPGTISTSELHDAERRLGITFANVGAMQDLAGPLDERYGAVLKSAE